MKYSHAIESNSFTDLYKKLHIDLLNIGEITVPRGMMTHELMNVSLVLKNPRSRMLYSKVRKHSYKYAAAEFLWYMSGSDSLEHIAFYLDRMREYSDDGKTLNSAYGNRIFGVHRDFPNQWHNVRRTLLDDPDSRQGVITIHYQQDLVKPSKDVPCTLNLHFIIRKNKLHLLSQMRSNDSYMGLMRNALREGLFAPMLSRCKTRSKQGSQD